MFILIRLRHEIIWPTFGWAIIVVILWLHEFTKVQGLSLATWVWTTATTSDWFVDLLVIEITKALLSKVRPVHIGARTERHHKTLNMSLINSILLLHFLKQLVILGLLLQKHNTFLVISLPTLEIQYFIVFQNCLLMHLFHSTLQLLILIH